MAGESDDLDKLFESVADGESVDWDALERNAPDEESRALIRQLRLIAGVADVHRSQVDEVALTEDASLTTPHAGAGGIPIQSAGARRVWPDLRTTHGEGTPPGGVPPAGPAPAPNFGVWGHLLLVRRIGEGSYGEVFHAHDTWLDHPVALKLLKPEAESRVQPSDLLHEARRLARVRHDNVVRVHGADRHNGRVGFWMDFIDGETLAARVSKGRLSAGEASSVGLELCRALAAVHRANIIHRDVKAQNVMRAHDGGGIILMDFGAGEFQGNALATRPQGTPLYMAPELFESSAASVRTDIYAAGVLLFHLVTNAFPVNGGSMQELREAHARGERRRLRDERPDLPDSFIAIVERALDPDQMRRYATAGDMEAKLSGEKTDRIDIRRGKPNEERQRAETKKWRRAWIGASAVGATVLFLTIVGAITSQFYYGAFGLVGSFQQESWILWPIWGLRALLAPVVLAGGITAVGSVLTVRLYRFALQSHAIAGSIRPIATRITGFVQGIKALPTATTGTLLVVLQWALFGLTWWWFGGFVGGLDALIVQTSGGDLSSLSPANAVWFRQVVSLELVLTAAAWFALVRTRRQRGEKDGWVSIGAGIAALVSTLILLVVPYRIVLHNDHERVSHRSDLCYLLEQRGNEALLFCPLQIPTRNRVVRLDDPDLERVGPEENMFTSLVRAVN